MEARELASAALVNADDLVKYDWYGYTRSYYYKVSRIFSRLTPAI